MHMGAHTYTIYETHRVVNYVVKCTIKQKWTHASYVHTHFTSTYTSLYCQMTSWGFDAQCIFHELKEYTISWACACSQVTPDIAPIRQHGWDKSVIHVEHDSGWKIFKLSKSVFQTEAGSSALVTQIFMRMIEYIPVLFLYRMDYISEVLIWSHHINCVAIICQCNLVCFPKEHCFSFKIIYYH